MPAFRAALALTFALTVPLVAHDRGYFAFCENNTCFSEGTSTADLEELTIRHSPVALFEHDGRDYILTDEATLARIREILRPQMELGRKQAALGEQQAKLGGQQARLGSRQAALGARQAALALDRDADRERAELQRQQQELGQQQAELGKQQSVLGKQQAELGKQQDAASRAAKTKIEPILAEAVRSGKARRR